MAQKISRRKLAIYAADRILDGDKDILRQVAAYLIDARQVRTLPLVVRDIEEALEAKGQLVADVRTSYPLTDSLKQELEKQLKKLSGAEGVHIRHTEDKSLIGGMHVSTPTKTLDTSISGALQQLKQLKK